VTAGKVRNVGASVRARLLESGQEKWRRVQLHPDTVRSGATIVPPRIQPPGSVRPERRHAFPLWSGSPHRATHDMDLLAFGPPNLDVIGNIFRAVAAVPADDGVTFLPDTVKVTQIREDAVYDGIRVTLEGKLGRCKESFAGRHRFRG